MSLQPLQFHDADRKSRGFTLLEVILVMVILSILATLTIPRLLRSDQHRFNLLVDEVGDLLTMYAQRENLSESPVGLRIDPNRYTLELVRLDYDREDPESVADWTVDQFVDPIRLPDETILRSIDVTADDEWIDIAEYPLSNDPAEARPTIVIRLEGARDSVTLTLPSHALAPRRSDIETSAAETAVSIDLDAAGRSREEW